MALAGEDSNDHRCLRLILEEFSPELRGRIVEVKDVVRLRDAKTKLSERVRTLHRHAKAVATRKNAQLACLLVCEDYDAPDCSNAQAIRRRVQGELIRQADNAHYLLAVAEIEAWLLLFPSALDGFRKDWQVPRRRRNIDTGLLSDPKRVLMTEVSNTRQKYRESDAPEIVKRIIASNELDKPQGRNTSWSQLRDELLGCHLRH